jgi:hypothetical protein
MVHLTLTGPRGKVRTLHWRFDATTDEMEMRLCREFGMNFREERPVLVLRGRALHGFERPWLFAARRIKDEAEIVFVRRSIAERAVLLYAPGDDGDDSDGYSTTSSVQAQMEALENWAEVGRKHD